MGQNKEKINIIETIGGQKIEVLINPSRLNLMFPVTKVGDNKTIKQLTSRRCQHEAGISRRVKRVNNWNKIELRDIMKELQSTSCYKTRSNQLGDYLKSHLKISEEHWFQKTELRFRLHYFKRKCLDKFASSFWT